MRIARFRLPRLSQVAAAGLFLMSAAADAEAKLQENCRRITIEGTAGATTEVATWLILDSDSPSATLAQSCPIQPLPNETNLEFMRRLAYRWGDFAGANCPSLLEPNPLDASNACVDLGAKSCRIKYKIAPKTTGDKKRYVEFCCYKDNVCGDKYVAADPIPITVVVDRDGSAPSCPAANCVDNCADCTVDVDPIAMRHLPTQTGADCRAALGDAMSEYAAGVSAALAACHDSIVAGTIPSTTDCNSVADDPATAASIAALAPIVTAATDLCALSRTPEEMGHGTCEEPCDAAVPVVSDWSDAADCLRCEAQNASIDTAKSIYGLSGDAAMFPRAVRTVSAAAQACQAVVGEQVARSAAVRAKTTADCQARVDAGTPLPAGASSCKTSDPKGKIDKARDAAAVAVANVCDTTALEELDLCEGATDTDSVAGCVAEAAKDLTVAVAASTTPTNDACLECRVLEVVSTIYDDDATPPGTIDGLASATGITVSPDGKNVYTVASDPDHQLDVFSRDPATGELTLIDFEWGGTWSALLRPTGVVVSPDGKHVYVVNNMGGNGTGVSLFNRDQTTGAVTYVAMYGASADFAGGKALVISADGASIYAVSSGVSATTGKDQIRTFSRDAMTGVLTLVQTLTDGIDADGINTPWDVAIAPDGRHVYVTAFPITVDDDNAVATFDRDVATGLLTFDSALFEAPPGPPYLPRPTGVAVSHDNKFVYVNSFDADVNVFRRDAVSGQLTFFQHLPSMGGPSKIAVSPDDDRIYVNAWQDAVSVFGRNLVTSNHRLLETELDGRDAPGISGVQGVAVSPDGRDVYVGSFIDRALTHFRVRCGNGVVETGEACDDGNGAVGDGCASDCTVE